MQVVHVVQTNFVTQEMGTNQSAPMQRKFVNNIHKMWDICIRTFVDEWLY
jgi:hypothetical protein